MASIISGIVSDTQGAAAQVALNSIANTPAVAVNRDRAAAAVEWGYEKLEAYEALRPSLFAASVVGCAISISMATRRRKVPEALALYITSAAISGAAAWFTRPAALRPAAVPVVTPGAPAEPGQSAMGQVLSWADRRVQQLDATRPGWRAPTWRRLARDVGFVTMSPYAETILALNRS